MSELVAPYPHAESMTDHWWWRPGMGPGRKFYSYFLTFDGADELHSLVASYQRQLVNVTGLDPVPEQWLHLTIQGLGFVDEVPADQRETVQTAVAQRLADVPPFVITFQPFAVHREAIVLPASPATALVNVKSAIRSAVAEVLGPEHVDGPADGYRPHVTLAYNTVERSSRPVVDALAKFDPQRATCTVGAVALVDMDRDDRMYKWRTPRRIVLPS